MANKSKYDAQIHPQLIKWMSRAGLVDEEIRKELGIAKTTLYTWAKKYPEVAEALRTSRNYVDSLVEDSLLKLATGYDYEETRILGTRTKDNVTVERFEKIKKHKAPETGACAMWLKNRRPPRPAADKRLAWQDTYRIEHESIGPGELPVEELTHAELMQEIRATEKALDSLERGSAPPSSPGKPDTVH